MRRFPFRLCLARLGLLAALGAAAAGCDEGAIAPWFGSDATDAGADIGAADGTGLADGADGIGSADAADAADSGGSDAGPGDAADDDGADAVDDTATDATDTADDTTDAADDALNDGADTPDSADADAETDADAGPEPFDLYGVSQDTSAFPYAVQSADPEPNAAWLQTWYFGDATTLRLVVAERDTGLVVWDAAVPVTADSGVARVRIDGLEPWLDYRYGFYVTDPDWEPLSRSRVGRFRTTPEPTDNPAVVLGATSCVDIGFAQPTPLARAAEAELDAFLWLGDTVYADGAVTLSDYRAMYDQTWVASPVRGLHASTASVYTWDDHEVVNNWNPETLGAPQAAAARAAFFEFGPPRLADAPDRIWRSLTWGRTVEVFVLDSRSERKPSTASGPDAEYLSTAQMAWLTQGLAASEATFKVILSSVPFTEMPFIYPSSGDRWQGYPAQRAVLAELVDDLPGVLFLGGDFHFGAVTQTAPAGSPGDAVPEIFVGPAAKIPNPATLLLDSFKAQFPFLTGTNNYVRLTLDPQADPPTVSVEFISGDGTVFHAEDLWF